MNTVKPCSIKDTCRPVGKSAGGNDNLTMMLPACQCQVSSANAVLAGNVRAELPLAPAAPQRSTLSQLGQPNFLFTSSTSCWLLP
ncbi:hypothetical protein V6N13_080020 [Hibiscus sabdariffa]|uniref:Uncharacterized protein n=1 Tax=Hibiscus sabdariffa TaxID=183260 RepID=A0ABR2RTR8_9ROSI